MSSGEFHDDIDHMRGAEMNRYCDYDDRTLIQANLGMKINSLERFPL